MRDVGEGEGQVGGSGGHVQDLGGAVGADFAHGFAAPDLVDSDREDAVEGIVLGRNRVKHFGDLLLFGAFGAIWFDLAHYPT